MRIIGCDLHARQQALAMLDTTTGEMVALILKLLVENRFPKDLAAFQGATRSAGFVAAPSSVGTHTDANTKCTAGDCLGEWSTTRPRPVEPGRTKNHSVVAARATCRLSAERVAGDVREVHEGDRKAKPASRGASLRTSRSAIVDDSPWSGT